MMIKSFEAPVRYQPGAATIDLNGELTYSAGQALNWAYSQTESRTLAVVFLNFGRVSYFNSGGIDLVISLLARARRSGRSLIAYGLSSHYLELFELAGLTEYIPVLPNEASVICHLPSPAHEMQPYFALGMIQEVTVP